jgi:hypothetical protein
VIRLPQFQQEEEKTMDASPSLFLPRLFLIPKTHRLVLIQMLAELVDLSLLLFCDFDCFLFECSER